jgi:hypothetical protein
MEGLGNTMKILSENNRPPRRDLNPEPSEYKTGALLSRSRSSVGRVNYSFAGADRKW